jgi:hypothetical protein
LRSHDSFISEEKFSNCNKRIRNAIKYFALAQAILYRMTLNILHKLDDAMRVNAALMDEATIDSAQLLRLLDLNLLRAAIENVRVLFASLGGTLPTVPTVAPIERSGRFFALANRMLQRNAQQEHARALERDAFAKAYSDLLAALSFAQHIARQVRKGVTIRNAALVGERIRRTAELYRAFRFHAWIKLTPNY